MDWTANFTGISDEANVYAEHIIIQKLHIVVDEEGAETPAASSGQCS